VELSGFIFFIVAILAVAGKAWFWILFAWGLFRAADDHQRAVVQSLGNFQALMSLARHDAGRRGGLAPYVKSRMLAQIMRARSELSRMDRISQQRYESRVVGMLGRAAAAGVDVSGMSL
jgi:hypothetical protein